MIDSKLSFLKDKHHGSLFIQLAENVSVSEMGAETLYKKQMNPSFKESDLIIIDVREESEWLHEPKIKRAIHLSKGIIERDIEKAVPNVNTPIVVYCSGGFRSRLAADSLTKMGYSHVFSLKGGMRNYQKFLDKQDP